MKLLIPLLCLLLGQCFLAGTAAAAPTDKCDTPNPLRFALIPRNDLARQMEEHRPLLLHLERTLKVNIAVVHATSYGSVIEGLLGNTIDLASMGPASYAIAKNRDPSITPLVTWSMQGGTFVKKGAISYHSLLIVRSDSAIPDLEKLKGKHVTLTDPASTSGGVLPRAEFGKKLGQRIEDYFGNITYSGSHDRSIATLKKGLTDAAFVASEHLDQAIRDGRIQASEIKVLWESSPIPHDPFVARGRLCNDFKLRLRDAFLANTPEIQVMLTNLKGEKFLPVNDEAFRPLRSILLENVP